MNPCDAFRRALEARLAGRPDSTGLVELGWHEHLLACGECRDLLEQEEALELLLASWPDPVLPPELATRVISRLRAREQEPLDDLLALDHVEVPSGLAERVLAGVAATRADRRLEALLDRAGEVDVPVGLARRVLARLEDERELHPVARHGLRRVGGALRVWSAAAAVLLVGGAGLWLATRPAATAAPDSIDVAGPAAPSSDDELIAWLPLLEYWDEVQQLEPLEAEIVTHLDEVDEALLEEGS